MKKVLFLLITLFIASFSHPYYLSVTDLKYNSKEKALQGYVKIFTNDLESALKKIHNKPVDLVNPRDKSQTKEILKSYLAKHLTLSLNDVPRKFELIGFEQEEESIWIYLEISKCELPKKVDINNTILYDYIKGQSNIVHVEVISDKKSSKVTNPESQIKFNF